LLALLLLTMLPRYTALADETQEKQKTVRVAYVLTDNFQEGGEGEHKYGYGYEYLQQISYYTGWDYTYVYGSFQECLNQLIAGDVDLMTNVTYTASRAEKIAYSALPQGEKQFYLYVKEGQSNIDPQDMTTLSGTSVGVSANSDEIELFTDWCADQKIYCDVRLYTSEETMLADLESGSLDAAMVADTSMSGSLTPLVQIGKLPYYFAVASSRTDLLEELDQAMSRILAADPYYADELKIKYLTGSAVSVPTLSEQEQAWLTENPVIRIGFLDDTLPYCTWTDDDQPDGMVIDLLDNMAASFSFSYEAVAFSSYRDLQAALDDGTVDAIFPLYGDYGIGEYKNIMVSDATTKTTMTVFNGVSETQAEYTVAITVTDPFQLAYVTLNYPDAKLTVLDSLEACVQAVVDGTADFTVVETAAANELQQKINTSRIQVATLQNFVDVSFATRRSDVNLLSILNKGILMTDDSLIINSLVAHVQKDTEQTIWEFVQKHISASIFVLLVVFGTIAALLTAYFDMHFKSKKQLSEAETAVQEERWRAEHDPLTGLLNRSAFDHLSEELRGKDVPIALVILDVDRFKSINDTYGHDVGDQALQRVSTVLSHTVRSNDHIIRLAGDEFVVLMVPMTADLADVVAAKLEHINGVLKQPADPVPSMSLSAGVAFSTNGYSDELFQKADQALYQTKEHGRCGYSISEL
jgi:diguanylate cyclase (GGDEF)-like protein